MYYLFFKHCLRTGAMTSLVHLRVPLGDRPPTDEVDHSQADGLSDLVTLMERCWDRDPDKRPSFGGDYW